VRLHGRWRSLITCIGRLTALVGATTGLVVRHMYADTAR